MKSFQGRFYKRKSISFSGGGFRARILAAIAAGLNTANRRYSMFGLFFRPARVTPEPDGSFASKADRKQLSDGYSGIS